MRRVDPKFYTKEYYLSDCTGFEEFKRNMGNELEIRLKKVIEHFTFFPGIRVLDIGCGRGEMVLFAAKNKAIAYGIDYSKHAIELANFAKSKQIKQIRDRIHFYVMDAKKLKFAVSSFDLVILTDVIEHLYDEEINLIFNEIKQVLKKEGKIVIHTAPNKLFNDTFYRYYCYPVSTFLVMIWNSITRRNYPNIAKPDFLRSESHVIMHINEQTYFSLKKLLKKYGFEGYITSSNVTVKKQPVKIKDIVFNFIVFFHPLSKHFPLNILFGSDFIGVFTNKK